MMWYDTKWYYIILYNEFSFLYVLLQIQEEYYRLFKKHAMLLWMPEMNEFPPKPEHLHLYNNSRY